MTFIGDYPPDSYVLIITINLHVVWVYFTFITIFLYIICPVYVCGLCVQPWFYAQQSVTALQESEVGKYLCNKKLKWQSHRTTSCIFSSPEPKAVLLMWQPVPFFLCTMAILHMWQGCLAHVTASTILLVCHGHLAHVTGPSWSCDRAIMHVLCIPHMWQGHSTHMKRPS